MAAKNNSESEYYGEILSRDVKLLTCLQKIIVKVEQMQDLEMVRVKNMIGKGKAFPTSTTIFRITGSSPWYSSEAVE